MISSGLPFPTPNLSVSNRIPCVRILPLPFSRIPTHSTVLSGANFADKRSYAPLFDLSGVDRLGLRRYKSSGCQWRVRFVPLRSGQSLLRCSFAFCLNRLGRRSFGLGVQSSSFTAETMSSGPEELPNQVAEVNGELYPPIEPYSTGFLKVSDLHNIYWEQSGNPSGYPVVFLHGGPGGGTSPSNRRFFDPEFYRIILFDQRGAGKSTPHACLQENTTWELIADIEKLREHLEIPEWQVFGGSWGSTLALAYSQAHPDKVTGLVLRGIFLLRKKEIDWFYEGGASAIYPDAWEPFRDLIPADERQCFLSAYSKRLNSDDLETQYAAARAWTKWEMMTAHLLPNEENIKKGDDDYFSLAFARIENHYFVNKGFFPSDSFLLDNVDKIRHINTVIVQGRYDVCCPMMSAWDLHKAWPEADFRVIPNAGHSANEPGIAAELVAANEKLKNIVKNRG